MNDWADSGSGADDSRHASWVLGAQLAIAAFALMTLAGLAGRAARPTTSAATSGKIAAMNSERR